MTRTIDLHLPGAGEGGQHPPRPAGLCEHPDWDEYREAMVKQGKSLIRVTLDSWGPIATGGFPARLAD
jgi:hypothetical protein